MYDTPFFYNDEEVKNEIEELIKLMSECNDVGKIINSGHLLDSIQLNQADSNVVVKFCTLIMNIETGFMAIADKAIKTLIKNPEMISSNYAKYSYPIDETIRAQILQCMGFDDSLDNLIPEVKKQKMAHEKVIRFVKSNFPEMDS